MIEKVLEVPAGEFKARCLKLMDEVRATRRPIVITKRGKTSREARAGLIPASRPEILDSVK